MASRGGVAEPLKISQVAGYIDQIETGGGAAPLNYIEDVKFNSNPVDETNPCIVENIGRAEYGYGGKKTLTFKVKKDCYVRTYPGYRYESFIDLNMDGESIREKEKNYTNNLTSGESKEIEIDIQDYGFYVLLFGEIDDYYGFETPDVIIIASYMNY